MLRGLLLRRHQFHGVSVFARLVLHGLAVLQDFDGLGQGVEGLDGVEQVGLIYETSGTSCSAITFAFSMSAAGRRVLAICGHRASIA